MRLIDVDELFNKAVNLEAVAFEQVKKYEPLDNPSEWHIWSAILTERTAFKYDLMDAPTIEAEPIRHGHWILDKRGNWVCEFCGNAPYHSDMYNMNYCPNCGAKLTIERDNITTHLIWNEPTVDAVEVVRCKDCKYGDPNGQYGCKCYHYKLYETHEMSLNDFCSRAERREDERK